MFLDEPTVELGIRTREMVWSVLRQLVDDGASIVLTTHYLEEAEALADRVAVISKGHLLTSGSVNEMRSLVVRTCISCSTSLDIDEVRKWPGVLALRRFARRLAQAKQYKLAEANESRTHPRTRRRRRTPVLKTGPRTSRV